VKFSFMGIGRLQWRHLNGTNARRSRISAQALITPPMGRILIALPDASRRVMKEHERIVLPTKEGYDRWSETYEEDDNPLILLEESHVARMVGNVTGQSILDVGCGTGRHSIRFANWGGKVTGLDFSTGMLGRARSKAGADSVTFVEHDITKSFPFDAGTFDLVLCCLVLDHVIDLPTFFAELRRVCGPEGFVVTSVMHPAMLIKGVQARFTDPTTGSEVRPESSPHQ